MKLEYLYVDGYKGLKKLAIDFKEQSSLVTIDFLIGRNGSGKSSVLEAIGLIFTRVMQDELPGFDFEIRYRMSDDTVVFMKPLKNNQRGPDGRRQRLFIQVTQQGVTHSYDKLPGQYMPDRIISYCSGANNSMEDILIASPRASLASDLYDFALSDEQNTEGIREVLDYYEQLDANPRALYLDAVTSKFIVPLLFAILPLDLQKRTEKTVTDAYFKMRDGLMERLNMSLIPVAFSFRVNDERLEHLWDLPQMGLLGRLFGKDSDKSEMICDWVVGRLSDAAVDEEGALAAESTVVFTYSLYDPSNKNAYYHPGLQTFFDGNPFILLSALLTAYREGVISDIHFTYRKNDEAGLYELEALSDGELMWFARMGLILLAQSHCGENTLFLLDEPDVHFNDDWTMEFINYIYKLSSGTHHAFLIATHATLILTDAMYEQIHLLDNESGRKTEVRPLNISTFAAQREEIAKQVFGAGSIGSFASASVTAMMDETDPEKMKENISRLGPGYERFRLYEQFYTLVEKSEG